jgi:chromosome segregation ATPase
MALTGGNMHFSNEELRNLVQLLEKHPEWRAELRHVVLTEELLSLPETVRALAEAQRQSAEAQRRTDEQLAILTDRVNNLALQMQQQAQQLQQQAQQIQQLTQRVDSLAHQVEILAQRLDSLTQRVDSLAHQVEILTQRLDSLTQRVDSLAHQVEILTQRLDSLTQRVDGLAHQVEILTQRLDRLTEQVEILTRRVDSLSQDVSYLKGSDLERSYRERGAAYFQRIARRIYVLSGNELSALMDQAVEEGRLSEAEVNEVLLADVVMRGRRREDRTEVYLIAEISWTVGPHDVERATRRAALLAKLGTSTIPIVAGTSITYEAAALARQMQAWQVLDGRTFSPNEAPFESLA